MLLNARSCTALVGALLVVLGREAESSDNLTKPVMALKLNAKSKSKFQGPPTIKRTVSEWQNAADKFGLSRNDPLVEAAIAKARRREQINKAWHPKVQENQDFEAYYKLNKRHWIEQLDTFYKHSPQYRYIFKDKKAYEIAKDFWSFSIHQKKTTIDDGLKRLREAEKISRKQESVQRINDKYQETLLRDWEFSGLKPLFYDF